MCLSIIAYNTNIESFPETQIPVPNYWLSTQMGTIENQHFNRELQ